MELNCCHLTQGAVIVVHVSSVEFLHASDVIHPTGKRGAFGSAVQVCHLESQMFLLEYSYVRTFAIASNLLKVNILINDKAELHHPTMVIASKDTSTMVGCNLACYRINGDIEAEDCTLQRVSSREVKHAQLEALPAVQSISSREVMPADREVSPPVQRELGMTNIVRERKGLLTCQARKYLRDLPDNSVEFSFPTGSVWHRVMAKLQERKQFLRGRGCTTTICMYDFLLDTLAARLFNRCKYVGSKFCTSGFEGQDGTVSS